MGTRMKWRADSSGLLTASMASWWGGRRNVVVECLPDGGWDWVAWTDGEATQRRQGQARSLEAAMTAAERGAAALVNPAIAQGHSGGL